MTAETTPTSDTVTLERTLEAILFIADEPVSLVALAAATSSPVPQVRNALEALRADYDGHADATRRAFELREIAGGWRMYVREAFDREVSEFVSTRQPSKLSRAALETLAVIAYRQPVTRQQVASIRAVNVDGVVRTLVTRGLIDEAGSDPVTGAIRYVTTDALLEHLGIRSLDELPKIAPLLDDCLLYTSPSPRDS